MSEDRAQWEDTPKDFFPPGIAEHVTGLMKSWTIEVETRDELMANPPGTIVVETVGSKGVRERYGLLFWLRYKWYVWRDR